VPTTLAVPLFEPGDTALVLHPPVPLTSGAIQFSALRTVEGAEYASAGPTWTPEDLNQGGASWVQDAGNDGHFSVAPGARVSAGCTVQFGSLNVIEAMTGDGTAPSSVTLFNAEVSGPITNIHALNDNSFGGLRTARTEGTGTPPGVYSYALSAELTIQGSGVPFTADQLQEILGLGSISVDMINPRGAITADGGATWRAYNPLTGWATLGLSNLETEGCQISGGVWLDVNGDAIDSSALDELALVLSSEGPALDLRLALGAQALAGTGEISSIKLESKLPDYVGPIQLGPAPAMGMGGAPSTIGVLRSSVASAQFSMPTYGDSFTDVLLTVWTSEVPS